MSVLNKHKEKFDTFRKGRKMTDPSVRIQTQLAVLIGAIEYRDNPRKMAEYIRKNREFFPKIKETHLLDLEK